MFVYKFWAVLGIPLLLLSACSPVTPTAQPAISTAPQADLSGIKSYLAEKAEALATSSNDLKIVSNHYYDLAQAANFDYAELWSAQAADVSTTLETAKAAWKKASPLYEQMEGIVAGTPSLADYDVILDAGSAGADSDNAVPFDLILPDGRVLSKPGNLFGITESTLWGTYADYTIADVAADLDSDGQVEFGESLPEANVLKAGADALNQYALELQTAVSQWEPTESDAFTALVVMTPTMSEYFNSWKSSRFVVGATSTQRDFVAISRLADIQDILGSLQVVYGGVKPLAVNADPAQAAQVEQGLSDLKAFVADVYAKEQSGQKFTAEEADLLGAEAQNRATAIAGQVSQLAAQLNIKLEE